MFSASNLRALVVLGVILALISTEWWLLNHALGVWPGLTGRVIVAASGVGALGLSWALTAWERRRRRDDTGPVTLGGQKRRRIG